MDEEDEIALKQINVQLSDGVKECSEDQFEDVIAFFEETAQNKRSEEHTSELQSPA